jgi:hypothetical protein
MTQTMGRTLVLRGDVPGSPLAYRGMRLTRLGAWGELADRENGRSVRRRAAYRSCQRVRRNAHDSRTASWHSRKGGVNSNCGR